MACCFSSRPVFLTLIVSLFVADVLSDILALISWYRCSCFVWFLIGTVVMSISFVMQWLYCLNNMNMELQFLCSFKYSGWSNYNHYLKPRKISKCKEMAFMVTKFVGHSIVLQLLLQSGIIEAFLANWAILSKYNKNSRSKRNIFHFDPQSNYNSISSHLYPNPVLQFNSNYITAHLADLCVLHCYFQSVGMALLHCAFFLSQLYVLCGYLWYTHSLSLCVPYTVCSGYPPITSQTAGTNTKWRTIRCIDGCI